MTYNVVYMGGFHMINLHLLDQRAFLLWNECMAAIKEQEAAHIVEDNPNPEDLSVANVFAICIWLRHVDAVVEGGTPVLPSILTMRNAFAQAIEIRSLRQCTKVNGWFCPYIQYALNLDYASITAGRNVSTSTQDDGHDVGHNVGCNVSRHRPNDTSPWSSYSR
eukprot:scaffold5777_cov66-Attheya_sp.AAC.3